MTHDEIEKLKIKISRAEANEQLEFAEILVNELIANNECYDENEYDIDKSYDYLDNLTSLVEKIKKKKELRKIKKKKDRYNNLPKPKQKILLKEIVKILNNIEYDFTPETNNKCRSEGHKYSDWEEIRYIEEQLRKDEDNKKKFIKTESYYCIKKCKRCGYEIKVEKEPEEITLKKLKVIKKN